MTIQYSLNVITVSYLIHDHVFTDIHNYTVVNLISPNYIRKFSDKFSCFICSVLPVVGSKAG